MSLKDKKRVSELFFYVRDNIDLLRASIIECDDLQKKENLKSQLEILLEIKSICEKRNRY